MNGFFSTIFIQHKVINLPSIGTTDGSFIEGDIALLSTAATSASLPKALTGGVVDSLGRLARLDRPDEDGSVEEFSLLRSAGKPVEAGFKRTAGAFGSPPWLFDPRAIKSPGGGWPGKSRHYNKLLIFMCFANAQNNKDGIQVTSYLMVLRH